MPRARPADDDGGDDRPTDRRIEWRPPGQRRAAVDLAVPGGASVGGASRASIPTAAPAGRPH